jgi:GTP cyclohydrolase I
VSDEKRFLVDVGMDGLPFPIWAKTRAGAEDQSTVGSVTIHARIMHEFEAHWIDRFIQTLHRHRATIGTAFLRANIPDYLEALKATTVRVDFDYPLFVEKLAPVSKEPCLVRYLCTYSAKVPSLEDQPKVFFKTRLPVITSYPVRNKAVTKRLFGQPSTVTLDIESSADIYLEELVEIVDRHALTPVYSFLNDEDESFLIEKIHSEYKSSVVMVDEIKDELARNRAIDWFSISCSNAGLLHSYRTVVATEKNLWLPFGGVEEDKI